jgi:hypothetical protein
MIFPQVRRCFFCRKRLSVSCSTWRCFQSLHPALAVLSCIRRTVADPRQDPLRAQAKGALPISWQIEARPDLDGTREVTLLYCRLENVFQLFWFELSWKNNLEISFTRFCSASEPTLDIIERPNLREGLDSCIFLFAATQALVIEAHSQK